MKFHFAALPALMIVCIAMSACAAEGVARHNAIRHDGFVGTWRDSQGATYDVTEGHGWTYDAHRTGTDGTTEDLSVTLMTVNGQTFCQIPIGESNGVPVYHFALIAITGDVMQHRAVDSEWIKARTGSDTGGVACSDSKEMHDLLAAAVRDNAFGPTETLRRQR